MTIASLYNTPTTPEGLAAFSFANNDEHVKIQRAVLALLGVNLPLFILDPIPDGQFEFWSQLHQEAHNAQNQVLGIAGNDLSQLDLERVDQIEAWVRLHAFEHLRAAEILGLN